MAFRCVPAAHSTQVPVSRSVCEPKLQPCRDEPGGHGPQHVEGCIQQIQKIRFVLPWSAKKQSDKVMNIKISWLKISWLSGWLMVTVPLNQNRYLSAATRQRSLQYGTDVRRFSRVLLKRVMPSRGDIKSKSRVLLFVHAARTLSTP